MAFLAYKIFNMSVSLVSYRYAAALYEAGGSNKAVYNNMIALRDLLAMSDDADSVLCAMSEDSFVDFCSGFETEVKSFFLLVRRNNRMDSIASMIEEFLVIVDLNSGTEVFELRSGSVLDSKTCDKISASVADKIGKKVVMHHAISDRVLGGFTATSRSLLCDATMSGSLRSIRESMLSSLHALEL